MSDDVNETARARSKDRTAVPTRDFRASAVVGVLADLRARRPTSKQRRQLERLHTVARAGDRVVVLGDGDPLAGVVAGLERAVARRPRHPACLVGHEVQRSTLRRAYQLQDPQLIFPLPGENGIAPASSSTRVRTSAVWPGTLAGGLAVDDEAGGHPHEPAASDP